MTINDEIRNRRIYTFLFVFYNVVLCFLLSTSSLTLTTLGDYLQYRDKLIFNISETFWFEGILPKLQTENFTVFLYTYLKLAILPSWFLGFLLFSFLIFRHIRKQKITFLNVFINLSIFNPIALQYFYYESKEFLSILFIVILVEIKGLKLNISRAILVLIRKENLLLILAVYKPKSRFFIYSIVFLLLIITIFLDYYEISRSIFIFIESSFAADGNTHRYWVITPSYILSFETLQFILIGIYTAIFSFLPFEDYFVFFLPLGIFKLILIGKLLSHYQNSYIFFVLMMVLLYSIPLSVYNVGSSTRYLSTAWIVLWLFFSEKERAHSGLLRIRIGKKVLFKI